MLASNPQKEKEMYGSLLKFYCSSP